MRATLTDEQRRVGYAVYFLDVLEAPERSEWGGIDGAISTIVREFSLPSGSRNGWKGADRFGGWDTAACERLARGARAS